MTDLLPRSTASQRTPTVALVRGEALNPFEMQAYEPLTDRFDLLAVGRTRAKYEVDNLSMPVTLLRSVAAHRNLLRLYRHSPLRSAGDQDFLLRLNSAVSGYDILHAAETVLPVSEQCARIAADRGRYLVLTCWETIPFRYDDQPRLAARKAMVRRQANHFIAVTGRARDALETEGVDGERISVVPAAVDCERFAPRSCDPALRRRWNVPQDAVVALYVGRMIQEKGITELILAFAGAERPDSAYLVLVGHGDQAGRARLAAEALGVGDRVRFLPGVSYRELPNHYVSADVVVAPSLTTPYWEEQFGMVLAECMASGRPLITTRSGAIPEVVGDAAVLVEPYRTDELSAALTALLTDSEARSALGNRGRLRAEGRYAVPVVAEQLAQVYTRVLENR